ncbi:hypothetical protein PMAYCL1PPCAC_14478 [Pristionchus mayeri]|uniref:Uncharacterized protein n=1 Tax=Pristionchus mayeri TaxID=1317129 RepID=A0AAN5CAK7_9BILA|nr:hypothetical protein PMAYCL1PPCAC_14478 [Pristionchus mayeri]
MDGSLYEFSKEKESGQDIGKDKMEESDESVKKETKKKERKTNVDITYRAMSEISEGDYGVRSLYKATCRRIYEVASVKTPLSQWKTILRKFEKSEERLVEGEKFLDMLYHSNGNMNAEIRTKEIRKVIKGITTRIFLSRLASFKKKSVMRRNEDVKSRTIKIGSPTQEKLEKEVDNIYESVIEILDGEKGLRNLFRAVYRKLREFAKIETSLSQWKSLMGKLEKSGEELMWEEEILEKIYHSMENMNVNVCQRAYMKLTRRIARRFLRAETLKMCSPIAQGQ